MHSHMNQNDMEFYEEEKISATGESVRSSQQTLHMGGAGARGGKVGTPMANAIAKQGGSN